MADEPQIEIIEEPNPRGAVNISFQKDSTRKRKYFEAEPKILGTTQIVLAFFLTSVVVALFHESRQDDTVLTTPMNIVAIIAGSLGIAAKNLHPPTIKACFGMQVVTCVATVITFVMTILNPSYYRSHCDREEPHKTMCESFHEVSGQLQLLQKLMMGVQVALSATLAAYCCKVIESCSPSSGVPVITVERPADAQ